MNLADLLAIGPVRVLVSMLIAPTPDVRLAVLRREWRMLASRRRLSTHLLTQSVNGKGHLQSFPHLTLEASQHCTGTGECEGTPARAGVVFVGRRPLCPGSVPASTARPLPQPVREIQGQETPFQSSNAKARRVLAEIVSLSKSQAMPEAIRIHRL